MMAIDGIKFCTKPMKYIGDRYCFLRQGETYMCEIRTELDGWVTLWIKLSEDYRIGQPHMTLKHLLENWEEI